MYGQSTIYFCVNTDINAYLTVDIGSLHHVGNSLGQTLVMYQGFSFQKNQLFMGQYTRMPVTTIRSTRLHIDHLQERQKDDHSSIKQTVRHPAIHADGGRTRARSTASRQFLFGSRGTLSRITFWARARRMITANILLAGMLLQLLRSGRLPRRLEKPSSQTLGTGSFR